MTAAGGAARLVLACCALAMAAAWPGPGDVFAQDPPRVAPGEVLVLMEPGAGVLAGASAHEAAAVLGEMARASGLRPRVVQALGRGASRSAGAYLVRYDDALDPAVAAVMLSRAPGVAYAGPNHVLRFTAIPDDPLFERQDELIDTGVPQAWERTRGAGILIAIVDTGLDMDHPDLVDRLAVNAAERDGEPGVDDDGNGYVDDVLGYDFTDAPAFPGAGDYLDRDPDPEDDYGHGTSVAGVACATWNDGFGIAGVAPEAGLLPLRAGFRTTLPFLPGLLEEDDAAAAVLYAADRGAHVINLSWGDVVEAPVVEAAVRYAREKGSLVVASAGNESNDLAFYPASYAGVLSVGASFGSTRAGFSTFGLDLDLLAPGVSLWTTTLGGGHGTAGGTSFSAPMTSGAAALVWSLHPGWTADEVAWHLMLTARCGSGTWSPAEGYGYLDAAAAVEPSDPPPVVRLTHAQPVYDDGPGSGAGGHTHEIHGTVAHPRLQTWELAAEANGGSSPVVSGGTTQVVGGLLSPWDSERQDAVLRLRARVAGYPVVEDRLRVPFTGGPTADVRLETMVEGPESWALLGTWISTSPQQGALQIHSDNPVGERFVEEASLGRHHAVRVPALTGPAVLQVLPNIRGSGGPYFPVPPILTVEVPAVPVRTPVRVGEVPPGTPFLGPVDFDADGMPEVLTEAPRGFAPYGQVRVYEWTEADEFTRIRAVSDAVGIPRAVGDADGDGMPEMVIYRVDAWTVWEACEPGGFPACELFSTDRGVPVAVVDGRGILVVTGPELRLLEAATAFSSGPAVMHPAGLDFTPGAAVADVDGDGLAEAVLLDREGGLVEVELAGDPVVASVTPGFGPPAGGPFWDGAWILTAESDPEAVEHEGDMERRLVRVRSWSRRESGWSPADSLAFSAREGTAMRFLPGERAYAVRDGVVDALGDGLRWDGRVVHEPSADGAVLLQLPGRVGLFAWAGNATDDPGALLRLDTGPEPLRTGGDLKVGTAEADSLGLNLDLVWQELPCSGSRLWRRTARDTVEIVRRADGASDHLGWGEAATYVLSAPGCRERTWTVRAHPVPEPEFRWDAGNLVMDLPAPLAPGLPPGEYSYHGPAMMEEYASVVDVRSGGRRVVLRFDTPRIDHVLSRRAWTADGLPVGGSAGRSVHVLPPYPQPAAVIGSVVYDPRSSRLRAAVDGALPDCPSPFRLEPLGLRPDYRLEGNTAILDLVSPLSAGVHTLSLDRECLGGDLQPGQSLDFVVGLLVFPNPVRSGVPLTVSNLPGPATIDLVDMRGETVHSWEVPGGTARLDVAAAPGLYMLRIESEDEVRIERVAVIR